MSVNSNYPMGVDGSHPYFNQPDVDYDDDGYDDDGYDDGGHFDVTHVRRIYDDVIDRVRVGGEAK